MILWVLAAFALLLLPSRFGRRAQGDCLSLDAILPVKGFFILLVFATHFVQYAKLDGAWGGPEYMAVRKWLGQMVVAPFLFFSGYGVVLSAMRKGNGYVRAMPVRRVARVLFEFDAALLIFLAVRTAMGAHYRLGHVIGALFAWDGIGNSNWYIFAVLCLYAMAYVSFRAFETIEGERRGVLAMAMLTCATFVWTGWMSLCRDPWWYNTSFVFVAGGWFALFRGRFEAAFWKTTWAWAATLGVLMAGCILANRFRANIVAYQTASILFALATATILARFSPRSRALAWCGRHLFSLYILQRLPMLALQKTPLAANLPLYFATVFAVTLAAAWLFDLAVPRVWNLLADPKEDKQCPTIPPGVASSAP